MGVLLEEATAMLMQTVSFKPSTTSRMPWDSELLQQIFLFIMWKEMLLMLLNLLLKPRLSSHLQYNTHTCHTLRTTVTTPPLLLKCTSSNIVLSNVISIYCKSRIPDNEL